MFGLLMVGFIGVFFFGVVVGAMIRAAFYSDSDIDADDKPDEAEIAHPNAWDILNYRETEKEREERILRNRDDL